MRRIALVVALALVAACGGDDDDGAVDDPVVNRDRELPEALQLFLDEVPDQGEVAFTATYHVLKRFGSEEHTVAVRSTPPSVTIETGELRVVTGPEPETCIAAECNDVVDDARLSATGVFSTFTTEGPKQAIASTAAREDAGDPVFSTRTVASVDLRCVEIPVQGVSASTWCITPEGIFGLVDTPAVRYELTEYRAG